MNIAKHWLITFFFFFNDTATTEIYTYCHTLSLHDALPILASPGPTCRRTRTPRTRWCAAGAEQPARPSAPPTRRLQPSTHLRLPTNRQLGCRGALLPEPEPRADQIGRAHV